MTSDDCRLAASKNRLLTSLCSVFQRQPTASLGQFSVRTADCPVSSSRCGYAFSVALYSAAYFRLDTIGKTIFSKKYSLSTVNSNHLSPAPAKLPTPATHPPTKLRSPLSHSPPGRLRQKFQRYALPRDKLDPPLLCRILRSNTLDGGSPHPGFH